MSIFLGYFMIKHMQSSLMQSSLKSHPLWVTLYIIAFHGFTKFNENQILLEANLEILIVHKPFTG